MPEGGKAPAGRASELSADEATMYTLSQVSSNSNTCRTGFAAGGWLQSRVLRFLPERRWGAP